MKVRFEGDSDRKHSYSTVYHRPRLLLNFLFIVLFFVGLPLVRADGLSSNLSSSSEEPTTVTATTTLVEPGEGSTIVLTTTASPSSTTSIPSTIVLSTETSPVTIPQPFDATNLDTTGSNFTTTTCPQFITSFLSESSFRNCVPFSLLLYTSSAFISLTRSVSLCCEYTNSRDHSQ